MSDTPRTDKYVFTDLAGFQSVKADFARQLERELTAALAEIERLKEDNSNTSGALKVCMEEHKRTFDLGIVAIDGGQAALVRAEAAEGKRDEYYRWHQDQLAATVKAEARAEAAEKDAKRYRGLRTMTMDDWDNFWGPLPFDASGEKIDSAIDAMVKP